MNSGPNAPTAILWWLVLPALAVAVLVWLADGRRRRRDTGLCVCRHPASAVAAARSHVLPVETLQHMASPARDAGSAEVELLGGQA